MMAIRSCLGVRMDKVIVGLYNNIDMGTSNHLYTKNKFIAITILA